MAKTKVPFAGKEKRKTANDKLPVPPPKPAQQAASAAPEVAIAALAKPKARIWVDGVQIAGDPGPMPASLKVENRKPPTKEQQAQIDKAMTKAKTQSADTHQKELRAAQKQTKAGIAKVKREVKKEKATAIAKGATTAMPAQGKAAMRVIADKAAKEHPITKVPPKGELTRLKARDAARKRNGVTVNGKKPPKKKKDGKSGSDIVLAMLKRKEGATRAELCKATGWAGVSVPGFARRANMKLVKDKKDGVTRYRVA